VSDWLANELHGSVPGLRVDSVAEDVWRVLVPSSRWAHDHTVLTVEAVDGGWIISDGGELAGLVGDEIGEMAHLLECAGADIDLAEDDVVTTLVADDEPLSTHVLAFAHYLSSAPVVWHARQCFDTERAPIPESPIRALAKVTRDRLVSRLGDNSNRVFHLYRKVRERGETVRVPLTLAPPKPLSLPLVVVSFVDMDGSEQAIAAAKRSTTWTFEVLNDLTMPKYLLIKGDERHVEHFAEFYDHRGVTALPFAELSALEEDARDALTRLGLNSSN
jgi:hypothetical protein